MQLQLLLAVGFAGSVSFYFVVVVVVVVVVVAVAIVVDFHQNMQLFKSSALRISSYYLVSPHITSCYLMLPRVFS